MSESRVVLLVICLWLPIPVPAAAARQMQPPATAGRIVVTITTLEGTVHLSGVEVELRAAGATRCAPRARAPSTGTRRSST
jgi:hypothetical protein